MATTRKQLRRLILRRFGDIHIATASTNGTTTEFTDTVNLFGESSRYAGRHAYFASGDNLGLFRHITGYNGTTQTLTFQTALPNAVAEGDEIEITNAYGMGVTHDAVNAAINWAITVAEPYALVPDTFDEATPFDVEGDQTIDLPDDWEGVEQVLYQPEGTQAWKPVRHAQKHGLNGWSVDHAARTVVITGEWASRIHNRALRLHGYTLPTPLEEDSDTTALTAEFIVNMATAHLMLDVVRARQGADWGNQGLYYEDQANRLRPTLTPSLGPSYTKI